MDATAIDGSNEVYFVGAMYDEAYSEFKSRKNAKVLELRLSIVQGEYATLLKRITKTPQETRGRWTGGIY